MKVLLIGFTKMAYMPYMNFYIEELKKNNCEIELLYWKRDNKDDIDAPSGVHTHKFQFEQEDSVPLIKKTKGFIKYRKYANSILKNKRFDLVVVLHSTPGILIYDILKKKYKYKYILDYRDFTYENVSIYKKMIKKLVDNAYCTFVSSKGYLKYLPKNDKIYTSHNLIFSNLENREGFKCKPISNAPIKIRFWGFIRHRDINISIINKLSNDNRYELHYHGREQATARELKLYCKENKIKNVFFHGEYKPKERFKFALDTDFIHNMYENNIKTVNAMGNKFYDGIIFNIPQLCTEGSFMGDSAKQIGVGNTFNPFSDTLADDIYKYYKSINRVEFEKNCEIALNDIVKEYELGTKVIQEISKLGEMK